MSPDPSRPHLRAILFDLDGTLYRQSPLKKRMLRELVTVPLRRMAPFEGYRTVRRLARFRRDREALRDLGRPDESLEELQYARPAAALGEPADRVRASVLEWMHERPLRHLAAARRAGAAELFRAARSRGLEVGVFSDYPVDAKLAALGLDAEVSLTLCATDVEVNAFKPHPAGFLAACERWGFAPGEVLYVGDRVEVDHAGATAAGMACALVGEESAGHPDHTTHDALRERLADRG